MRRLLPALAIVAAVAFVVEYRVYGTRGRPAHDVYAYFYPNILYALRSLAAGQGLYWNPFQNCGQPFLAISSVGLFYPLNVAFLVVDPPLALHALLVANLLIGGFGTYGLAREIGSSPVGALGGALAFTLGASALHVTSWMPTVQAPSMWMPVAMWACERLLKRPHLRPALVLGLVLGVSLLPGHPQFVLFTCQLIALRWLWGLLDASERRNFARTLGGLAVAAVVMLLAAAIQLLPSLEVTAESLRSAKLLHEQIGAANTWQGVVTNIDRRSSMAPFVVVPGFIAAAALASSAHRRVALFYMLSGALFLTLSFGLGSPLGKLYYALPFTDFFRVPVRFQFVTGFCVAVLTSLGIDVLMRGSWGALAAGAAALGVLYSWLAFPLREWWLAAGILGGGLLSVTVPVARSLSAMLILGAVGLAPVIAPLWTLMSYSPDDRLLHTHAEVMERLRERSTPQDRAYLAHTLVDRGFEAKTGGLYEIPVLNDLEPQMTRRYAEYVTMLRRGVPLRSLNQVYYPGPWNPLTVRWPLVDLAAGRYVVVDKSLVGDRDLPFAAIDGDESLRVYANPNALPRTYYVPQIAVEALAEARLSRLAAGREDRRRLALVASPTPSGFSGVPGNEATAEARFEVDEPERVVIQTVAPQRGFLFLADQYFPGWSATVNGEPATILIANHAFRLVEVPAGPVTVEFRYRPRWIWIGALITISTLLVVGALLIFLPRLGRVLIGRSDPMRTAEAGPQLRRDTRQGLCARLRERGPWISAREHRS